MNYTMLVHDFMKKHGQRIAPYPQVVDSNLAKFRTDLIEEELNELKLAIETGDIYLIADALADLKYVIFGAELTFGLVVNDTIFEMVHISNMSKDVNNKTSKEGDPPQLKVQKGDNYRPPKIKPIIDAAIKMGKEKEPKPVEKEG